MSMVELMLMMVVPLLLVLMLLMVVKLLMPLEVLLLWHRRTLLLLLPVLHLHPLPLHHGSLDLQLLHGLLLLLKHDTGC